MGPAQSTFSYTDTHTHTYSCKTETLKLQTPNPQILSAQSPEPETPATSQASALTEQGHELWGAVGCTWGLTSVVVEFRLEGFGFGGFGVFGGFSVGTGGMEI